MSKHILVTSPQSSFCELLRSSLEETGKYSVQVAATGAQALACARDGRFALAILNSNVEELPVAELGRSMQELYPDLLLVVIPPENDSQHLSMVNFTPDGYLERPFYLPDLLEKLAFLLDRPPAPQAKPASAPFWLLKSKRAGPALDKQLRETFLHAALLFDPVGKVVAHSSGLPDDEAHRLVNLFQSHFAKQPGMELACYTRPELGERLVYLVPLIDGTALAGLMDATVPVSQARFQMQSMREGLLKTPEEEDQTPKNLTLEDDEPCEDDEDFLARLELEGMEAEEDGDSPAINLTDLLAGMPPPDPDRMPISIQEWQHLADDLPDEEQMPWEQAAQETSEPSEAAQSAPETPPPGEDNPPMEPQAQAEEGFATPQNGKAQPQAQNPADDDDLLLPWEGFRPPHQDWSEPQAQKDQGVAAHAMTEAAYTCIMIPRLVRHTITLEMGERLKQWLPQHCLAFGWSLEGMAVTAEYLLWTVRVTTSVSQGSAVRVIRQRTSENLFSQYPYLKEQNSSGDFWAPGYLVVSGSNPPAPELLRNFIYQTRRRQGLYRF